MLILKRRVEERLEIRPDKDEPITIKVIRIVDGQVELGIEAPRTTEIRRIKDEGRRS